MTLTEFVFQIFYGFYGCIQNVKQLVIWQSQNKWVFYLPETYEKSFSLKQCMIFYFSLNIESGENINSDNLHNIIIASNYAKSSVDNEFR